MCKRDKGTGKGRPGRSVITESCEDLYRKNSLKRLLRRFEIETNRDMGQHFLFDREFLEAVAKGAGEGEIAVEVGAGPGSLTCLLKERFERIFAVEIDERFHRLFREINPEVSSVEFVRADFLDLNFFDLGLKRDRSAVLVGNIPYNITGKILERAVEERDLFSRAVFTMQKEVAERVVAEPGTKKCGAITFYVQAYGEVNTLAEISPDSFYPPPEVDSSVIEIVFTRDSKIRSDAETYFSLVRGLFNYRRKTIRKGLIVSPRFSLTRYEVDELLNKADMDPRKRPEELTLEDFDRLALALGNPIQG